MNWLADLLLRAFVIILAAFGAVLFWWLVTVSALHALNGGAR